MLRDSRFRSAVLAVTVVGGGLVAASATAAPPTAGPKQDMCNLFGCPDETDLECFSGRVKLGAGPIEVEGEITCYEPRRPS